MTRSSRKGKGSEGKGERGKELGDEIGHSAHSAYFCASLSQIWILEFEYSQKVSSHAQIGPLGAEKQQRT